MNWKRLSFKRWGFWGRFLGLCCLCLFLVISCGKRPDANAPNTNKDRIILGTTLKPRTLDPADAYELAASNVLYSLGDRLYTYQLGSDRIIPQLASELPKISPDGKTYTIPLRKGVVFHDSTPFNAEAMAFSLRRFKENGGKPSALLTDIVDSIQVTGEYEIAIKLKTAFAAFPALLAYSGMAAVSPKAYEIGNGKFTPAKFVGTGPYKLVEFGTNAIKLDVFDQYWGQKPPNQGIDLQIFSSSSNLFNSFKTGAVDLAYQSLDPDQIASLQQSAASSGVQVLEAKSNVLSYMVLNTKLKPLDKVEVRQAIASLIDRQLITERILRKQGEPAYSMIPTTFEFSQPVFKTVYGDANITKAKELLAKAGVTATNPLKLEIWYPSGSAIRQQVASILKESTTKELNGLIDIQPQAVESATFFANIRKGLYQSALVDWYPDFSDADNYIQPFLSCNKGSVTEGCVEGASQSQGSFYYSDRMNQLIAKQRSEQKPTARKQIFADIQQLMAQDVPLIPLWQNKDFAFAKKGLKGVTLDPIQQLALWQVSK